MKSVLIFILLLPFSSLSAQFYLGATRAEVLQQIKDNKGENILTSVDKENLTVIEWENIYIKEAVFFNSNNKSEKYIMRPKKREVLNGMIKTFNSKYVIINNEQWKAYVGGTVTTIILLYMKDDED